MARFTCFFDARVFLAEKPLKPATPVGRAKMRVWTKVPDNGLHTACASVSYAAAFVHQLRAHHDKRELEERLRKLPDRARAARQRQILEMGFVAPIVKDAVLLHDKVLREMDATLSQ